MEEIGREFQFPIKISSEWSREGNSELQKSMYPFEAASLPLFIKREIFKILVSERRIIHRELRKKLRQMREFATGYIVVVRNQIH